MLATELKAPSFNLVLFRIPFYGAVERFGQVETGDCVEGHETAIARETK